MGLEQLQIFTHTGTPHLLHVPGYAFFHTLADFAVPGPRILEMIEKLFELLVVHLVVTCYFLFGNRIHHC
jgi:hypothetical protein